MPIYAGQDKCIYDFYLYYEIWDLERYIKRQTSYVSSYQIKKVTHSQKPKILIGHESLIRVSKHIHYENSTT